MVLEDALAANGPHLQALQRHQMDFIIVAKPQGNAGLFNTVGERLRQGLCTEWEEADPASGLTRGYRFTHQVPLNHAHPELCVNFLEYWEVARALAIPSRALGATADVIHDHLCAQLGGADARLGRSHSLPARPARV